MEKGDYLSSSQKPPTFTMSSKGILSIQVCQDWSSSFSQKFTGLESYFGLSSFSHCFALGFIGLGLFTLVKIHTIILKFKLQL
jgi:hypothetical protein